MRGIKAEGGWGVIFTEQCEIHPSSEITSVIELRLWEGREIPLLSRMAERMKSHGALAGIQLAYPGVNGPNLYTREVLLAVSAMPRRTFTCDPVQARALDRQDIRDLRRWFVMAARRAQTARFDLICLYGAHGFGIFQQFLSRATNQRRDEYGGSLENRSRFLREAVGERMAITLCLLLDESIGALGFSNAELRDFIALNRKLPDLWDLAQGTWEECSGPSRFQEDASQEALVRGIRGLTDRPFAWGASPLPMRWYARSAPAFSSSGAPVPRSPPPSCRRRSRKAPSRTSANASAATSASPAT
ncbi:NADH:flavin oxidoreductase, Old Yellow Enzyme family [Rubellimicrobium thermophilum DSM 16684]|uniref:NADH:flavin oxidoreductase, Old Yellow Enzyme family n=1 Tax=Rubellimicrobium thermophilum DSM 16684 TaxID=1123069 RepID=S9QN01_9RHOB|nr:NADH:flavin oxidoreductase, Old Yellow Enzyme family [Rubellimicrobium thermophilum]EPX82846.1 NADH:flavin oxidoreductase, Old Yellow Enzyme family [Rubellimicrobium thermophilum DSM 16684]